MAAYRSLALTVALSLALPTVAMSQSASQIFTAPGGSGQTQPVSPNNPLPVTTKPNQTMVIPLDVSTVTTANTAVTALSVGHRTAGGYLITANAAGICISENGTAGVATGYSGAVQTTCVVANEPYNLAPSSGAVSVNSTSNSVAFSGYGLQ